MSIESVLAQNESKRQELYEAYKSNLQKGFIFLIVLVGFYFLAKAAQIASEYRRFTKQTLIKDLVKENYEDGNYIPNDSISLAHINSLNFYRRPDRFHGEDLMNGSFNGVKFACSDIHMEERVETRDSKGNVQVSYQTIFKGRWYHFAFQRDFKQTLHIAEAMFAFGTHNGLKKYETESVPFNKKFKVFSTDQQYVFYQITPVLIEKLLEFEKMHRGTVQLMYHGNELDVAVYDSSNSFELKLKTPLNKESIKNIISDIEMPAAMINEFKLDSDKFKLQ